MKIEIKVFTLLVSVAFIALVVGHYAPFSMMASIVGLMLLSAGMATFYSRTITIPLQTLMQWAIARSQNEYQELTHSIRSSTLATLAAHRRDEIGRLAQALQGMQNEWEMAIAQLQQSSSAKERMESELRIGREIQMNMLTLGFSAFPKHKDLEIYAVLEPAQEVGGDFYDFYFRRENLSYLFEENRFCFCVGDVSGKGVPAALFMAVIKTLLKSQSYIDLSPANILTHVNEVISADNPMCMFVTLFFGVLNLTEGELVYTNAGHNPPYIRRRDGSIEQLNQRHGAALGVLPGLTYTESRTSLQMGDILITYTDGVTEAMDVEQHWFSDQRFCELLRSGNYNSAKEVVALTTRAITAFQGDAEQSDDLTMLALQFLRPPSLKGDSAEIAINSEALSSLREGWK
ncbi:MAG: PP2C family protein-serine/threonine phosphatase [Leptolyngbyaceae cyanobacterium bins.349]|nr:PP2C family protein-serine/threonine phosphatase [Leptolyngbyaceae cyanobacterium bins.349]